MFADLPPPPPPVIVSHTSTAVSSSASTLAPSSLASSSTTKLGVNIETERVASPQPPLVSGLQSGYESPAGPSSGELDSDTKHIPEDGDPFVERRLLQCLCEVSLNLPTDSRALVSVVTKALQREVLHITIENLLQKFAAQELISIKEGFASDGKSCILITGAEHTKVRLAKHGVGSGLSQNFCG